MSTETDAAEGTALSQHISPVMELVERIQRKNGWSDQELEIRLGLSSTGILQLARQGAIQLSYRTVLHIEQHLDINPLKALRAFIAGQADTLEEAVVAMYTLLKVDPATQRISDAYSSVLEGNSKVVSVKVPNASVWIVPDAAMKRDDEDQQSG